LNKIVVKKGSNPVTLLETLLATIEDNYGCNLEKLDLIEIILAVEIDEYQYLLIAEKNTRGDTLTLLDLELIMNQQ
jgi:hypothetical protein